MKSKKIKGLLDMMGVKYQTYQNKGTYIYVESLLEDDEAMWQIDFIDGVGYNHDTNEVVNYKLLAQIKFHNNLVG